MVNALLTGLAALAAILAWRYRRTIRRHWRERVEFTKGYVYSGAVVVSSLALLVAYTTAHDRNQRAEDRNDRIRLAEQRAVDHEELRAQRRLLEAYARRQAMLAQPSRRELARRSRDALAACASSERCRMDFTRVVNRVLRVEGDRVVPAPSRSGRPRPGPAPPLVPAPAPTPPAPSTPGRDGPQGPQGPAGTPGRDVDSAIVDGLENRIADLERGLAGVLRRLGVLDAVCRLLPAACR